MTVEIQLNGTALDPQPRETTWTAPVMAQKLNGTNEMGAYYIHTLRAPVGVGGTANWNWGDLDNTVLTSIQTHAPYDTMKGNVVTYSSGVVSRQIVSQQTPPGGLVRSVEMEILVII